jgi:hypothetical protein
MKMFTVIVLFGFLFGAMPVIHASESVVYIVSHYDKHEYYDQPCKTNEVFTISTSGGSPVRAFSDAGRDFVLPCTHFYGTGPMAVNPKTHVLYVPVTLRSAIHEPMTTPHTTYNPSEDTYRNVVLEISLDGSGHYRKLIDYPKIAGVVNIFLNSVGDRIRIWDGEKFSSFDSKTGAHLSDLDLSGLSLFQKCEDCPVLNAGWLNRSQRLFLTLGDPSGEFYGDDPRQKFIGSWVMREDGSDLKRISPPLGRFEIPGPGPDVFNIVNEDYPTLLRENPDGDYVFFAEMSKVNLEQKPPVDFLVISNPKSNTNKIVSSNSWGTSIMGVSLSPAGDLIAYASHVVAAKVNYKDELNPTADIYVKSLTDDSPRKLASYVPDVSKPGGQTHLWVIGWAGGAS